MALCTPPTVGATFGRPFLSPVQPYDIRTLLLHFATHVGERRNFCFAEIRRPACVCLLNLTIFPQCSAHSLNFGNTARHNISHTARLHNLAKHHNLQIITQTPITPQTSVGANSVLPSLFAHMVCINSNITALRTGRRISVKQKLRRSPTFWLRVLPPQNRCRSLRTLLCKRGHKSGAEFSTPTPLCFLNDFDILLLPICTA